MRPAIDFAVVAILAAVLAGREFIAFQIPLPQIPRQTRKDWVEKFGPLGAGFMWGLHIGLGWATVMKHGGFYVIAVLALILRPIDAAVLMSCYWLGRALPLFVAPFLVSRRGDGMELAAQITGSARAYRHAAGFGLGLTFVLSLVQAASG